MLELPGGEAVALTWNKWYRRYPNGRPVEAGEQGKALKLNGSRRRLHAGKVNELSAKNVARQRAGRRVDK